MKIAIAGASGFIGTYLTTYFSSLGHEILSLERRHFEDKAKYELAFMMHHADAVINLSGEKIAKKWTINSKQRIYDSRIDITRRLVEAINQAERKPKILISTSAVGYYPNHGCFDEFNQEKSEGFLPELCAQWESQTSTLSPYVRLVVTRFGLVLGRKGGMLKEMTKLAKWKIATFLGDGLQPFPWIDLHDVARALYMILIRSQMQGVYNFVAPQLINNRKFADALAKSYGCWFTMRVPAFLLKLIFGKSSQLMLEGQCVKPTKLLEAGFTFESETIDGFFKRIPKHT